MSVRSDPKTVGERFAKIERRLRFLERLTGNLQVDANGKLGHLLWGDDAPTGDDGNDGDSWVDRASLLLYGPKADGVWPDPIPLGDDSSTAVRYTSIDYTVTAADAGDMLVASAALTFTLPDDASAVIAPGSRFDFMRYGSGAVSVAGFGSVAVRFPSTADLAAQFSTGWAMKIGPDEWVLGGDFA